MYICIWVKVFRVLLNFLSECNQPATGNCLNGVYSQRLADVIQNNDFDFDKPIAVHICHSKCFPVAG